VIFTVIVYARRSCKVHYAFHGIKVHIGLLLNCFLALFKDFL
jgi:hypothetical protein